MEALPHVPAFFIVTRRLRRVKDHPMLVGRVVVFEPIRCFRDPLNVATFILSWELFGLHPIKERRLCQCSQNLAIRWLLDDNPRRGAVSPNAKTGVEFTDLLPSGHSLREEPRSAQRTILTFRENHHPT